MKTFDEIYEELQCTDNNELMGIWVKANEERKKTKKIILILCLIIDLFMLICVLLPMTQGIFGFGMLSILQIVVPIIVIDVLIYVIVNAIFSKNRKQYSKMYKEIIINKLINNFYSRTEYFPQKQMPKYIYNEAEYNEYYNRYYSDDYFEAFLNDKYSIQMAEVKTEEQETHTDSDGKTTTTTTLKFHGLFGKIIIDKSINGELKIMQNGKMLFNKNQLKMDSSEFEKYFDVKASNKIVGMQLLTADVMEELIEFQNKTNIKYDICIKNNNLYLRFHCGTMFEPQNIKHGVIDKKSLQKYFYMLNFTYNLSNKLTTTMNDTEI